MDTYQGLRAAVVGGSIGGLTGALLLRELGFTVDVYERTPTLLENRGGGIVLQPTTMKWFGERSARRIEELSTVTRHVRHLGGDNEVVHDDAVEWRYSSWSTIYRALLDDFGTDHYHLGEFCAGFDQDADGVTLRFVSGRTETATWWSSPTASPPPPAGGCSPTSYATTPDTSAGAAPSRRAR
ncbi:hypothetical protein [Streptomyces sp. NPDC020480]|uniref:hypothetical protein n=1 Tax=Streptomyces sp. NPDC020480 TaxID=3365076 RepID=UPI003794AE2F